MIRTWTAAGLAYLKTEEHRFNMEALINKMAPEWFPSIYLNAKRGPMAEALAKMIAGLRLPRVTDLFYAPPIVGARSWWPNGRTEVYGIAAGDELIPCVVDFWPRGDSLPDLDSEDLRALPVLETRTRSGVLEDLRLVTPAGRYWTTRGAAEDGALYRCLVEREGSAVHAYEWIPQPVAEEG